MFKLKQRRKKNRIGLNIYMQELEFESQTSHLFILNLYFLAIS
jgi:hypothetical protein